MQGFIEIQSLADGSVILLPIGKIRAVLECDYGAFIETDIDGKGRPTGIPVSESYIEIKQKIFNAR